MKEPNQFYELLLDFGYDPAATPAEVIRAFHRHFYPEKFVSPSETDQPDATSAARLLSLMRQSSRLRQH
jgi:N-acetyl-anhydromuramyl-L-alanine amidase AmpD